MSCEMVCTLWRKKNKKTTLIQFCVSNVIPAVLSKKGLFKKHIPNTNGVRTVLQATQTNKQKKQWQNGTEIKLKKKMP